MIADSDSVLGVTLPDRVPLTYNAWLRYDVMRRILSRRFPDARSFLEVGCGQGALAARLSRQYEYVGFEPDAESSGVASRRLSELGTGEIVHGLLPSEPTRTFDLVGAFEVLEHLEDDLGALQSWREWLCPGGGLLLSVPAHQHRYSTADSAVGHYRRYGRDDLRTVVKNAGFDAVEVMIYGFPLGNLLEFVRNRLAEPAADVPLEKRTEASGRTHQPPEQLWWLTQFATAPFRILQRPFIGGNLGTGFVLAAIRRD
ncbi:MAG: class I SAM-dependent methyltransferase [Acidimicrobiia bacterium]